ncbi:hypothetical protein EV379_0691 [Microterricola gilva]|uniref:SAF domain-containing protein n=1 Tax=Microterricola gilva TaxID=393267 RepID=A0A4V2GAJ0_9MICO|nr:hypothetical protein [Microterricola gilva]RZU64396.1 hypothetical protein EV379_0691 [Microterricola gilva]
MGQEKTAGAGAKRPLWFDPRFAVGVVLVLGSIIGVTAVVASVDDSAQMYVARTTMPAGTTITAAELEPTAVRLGTAESRYLDPAGLPEGGLVLTRAVAAGELIPLTAVSDTAELGRTGVVVALSGDIAASVAAGAPVDLWAAQQLEHGRFGPPGVIVSSAEVVRVLEDGGLLGSAGRSVELRLPTSSVAAVLQAVANGDALSLVPASPGAELGAG